MSQTDSRLTLLLIVGWVGLLEASVVACEDEHPQVTRTPIVKFSLNDLQQRPIIEMAFDPRGLGTVKTTDEAASNWVRDSEKSGAWDYREWQWWKGHPWGDSCRPRYWTTAQFSTDKRSVRIQYRVDGFDCEQKFFLPGIVDAKSPHWDVVISVKNSSGQDVEEYGQFFACYTNFNEPDSFWFWEAGNQLVRFADRGVEHLNGYVANPQAYFLSGGAIPHCQRGDGKIVAKWHRPVLVSQASPGGWRSVIMLDPEFTAGLSQGIHGGAMDYIIFPGTRATVFEHGTSFSVHVRHYLLKSPKLPSPATIETLWEEFRVSHESIQNRK